MSLDPKSKLEDWEKREVADIHYRMNSKEFGSTYSAFQMREDIRALLKLVKKLEALK